MFTECRKCKKPKQGDNLTPEGDCWDCSIGDEGEPNTANIRESMHNIAHDLAEKTGDLTAKVKKALHTAAKDGRFN